VKENGGVTKSGTHFRQGPCGPEALWVEKFMGWSMTDDQTETWNCFYFVVPGFGLVSLEWMAPRIG
jgi:hypothetical protein